MFSRNRSADLPQNMPSSMGEAILAGCSIPQLRALRPMPEDAQKLIDDSVVRVGLDRLTVVRDLIEAGLVYNLPDPMSVLALQWDRMNEVGNAQRTMIPKTRGERQMPDRDAVSIPIYMTFDDFSLGIRTLRASERVGAPLDTTLFEMATRRVNELIEDAAINGAGLQVNGATTPGLLTAPNVNTQAYSGGESWTLAAHDGEDILGDVSNMLGKLEDDKMYGEKTLYVPTAYFRKLTTTDFKAQSALTILQRLEEIRTGNRNLRIRAADMLPTDRTVMVEMNSSVIQEIIGQQPIPISWSDGPGFERYYMVMAFVIPRVKDNYTGQSGIVVGYTS
jgi:hypothetical protein